MEEDMVAIHAEKLHDLAVVECKGRIVRSDSVFKLRDFVQAQAPVRTIALDLSEVEAIDGGGLGMLAFLERWARQKGIGFKLFSPSRPVRPRCSFFAGKSPPATLCKTPDRPL